MLSKKQINPYPLHNANNSPFIIQDYYKDLDIFIDKPFYCGYTKQGFHDCCFNHIIQCPIKNGIEHPIYDYELIVIKAIENNRNIWIKKSRGIGATELILRYLTWKILSTNELHNKKIFIISGTREIHSNDVKERMEKLFTAKFPDLRLESKYTQLKIKNTIIKCMPSRNVKDLRGYTDVSYLFIDEADHFEASVNPELLAAITAYEEKSKCTTIMCSTPNRPDGLFASIEKDKNSKYKKILLPYELGLDKIYNRLEIEAKMLEPEFEREYNLKYLGKQGNFLTPAMVESLTKRYEELDLANIPDVYESMHIVGLDAGYGSSAFGICMTQHIRSPNVVRVTFAEEFEKANPQDIIDLCHGWHRKYYPNIRFIADGSAVGFIRQLRSTLGENPDWDPTNMSPETNEVIAVSFAAEHKNLMSHLYHIINKGYLAIDPKYEKLIISLRTAQVKELSLLKQETSHNDILDALRLSLKGYVME